MKKIWQILNSITITLFVLVMLIFFKVIRFEYTVIPLIFSGLFLLFFLIINWFHLKRESLVFFFIAFVGAIGYELFAAQRGLFIYHEDLVKVQNIPVCVILTWFAFFAHIHHYNNGFLTFLGFEKPKKQNKNSRLLALLIIADGLQIAIFGQLLDFVFVKTGFWTWTKSIAESGFYEWYVGLFYFTTGILISLIFRLFQYFSSTVHVKRPPETYLSFNLIHLLSLLIGTGFIFYMFNFFYFINIIILALNVVLFDKLFKKIKNR